MVMGEFFDLVGVVVFFYEESVANDFCVVDQVVQIIQFVVSLGDKVDYIVFIIDVQLVLEDVVGEMVQVFFINVVDRDGCSGFVEVSCEVCIYFVGFVGDDDFQFFEFYGVYTNGMDYSALVVFLLGSVFLNCQVLFLNGSKVVVICDRGGGVVVSIIVVVSFVVRFITWWDSSWEMKSWFEWGFSIIFG